MPAVAAGVAFGAISGAATSFILTGAVVLKSVLISAALGGLRALLAPKPPKFEGLGASRPDTRSTVFSAVEPARWITGRARVGGLLAFWHERDGSGGAKDLHIAVVLCEGACDAIEAMWVDGKRVSITRAARAAGLGHLVQPSGGRYRGKLKVYEYFAANGQQGDTLRAAAPGVWTANHRLEGLSWVHVHLTQPPYGNDADKRVWARFPKLEFLVRGIKVTWPGQPTPVWTESAAALRYWWLRERRGVPDTAIDAASVMAAHTLCTQVIHLPLPADYTDFSNRSTRYAINGVVRADDDPVLVEAEMDYAWQGFAVEADGVYVFKPGAERVISRTITPDDIIEIKGVSPAPALQARINAATVSIAQSREHDWLELSLPELTDQPALDRDGERLAQDLGTRAFLADPIAAGRLLAIALRRARASATFTYRVRPGHGFEFLTLQPTDWVTLTDPEHGLDDFQAMVTRVVVNEDWSVELDCVEQPAGVYADTLLLPSLKPRRLDIPTPDIVPDVTGLAAAHTHEVSRDGTVYWHIDVTWDDAPYHTRLRVTDGNDIFREEARIDGVSQRFTVDTPGTYRVTARHITRQGFASDDAAEVTLTFGWADVALPAPVILSTEQYGNSLQMVTEPIINRDVAGIEMRYNRGSIDAADALGALSEDNWFEASRADVTLVAALDGERPLVANVIIPATARYRLFVRLFNRLGNYGPITEIGYKRLVIPGISTLSPQQWPLWAGTLNNLYLWPHDLEFRLYPDYEDRSAITRDQWNGEEGWPFGPVEGYDEAMHTDDSTYYETEIIDLGQNSRIDVVVDAEFVEPPNAADGFTGTVATNTATVEYVYRAVATNTAPDTPTGGAASDDFVPSGWSAASITPSAALAYVFRSTRTQSGGAWTDNDFEAPTLWAKGDITTQTAYDVYMYYGFTDDRAAMSELQITGLVDADAQGNNLVLRYLAFRIHLKQWRGAALSRFVPQIRRLA